MPDQRPPHPKARAPLAAGLLALTALALTALALTACTGASVTFSLGPTDESLKQRTVAQDATASLRAPAVAQIDLSGLIADREAFDLLGAGPNPLDEFVVRLEHAAADPDVRAVIIRINSPGGTVAASDLLYDEIARFKRNTSKPVVVSMGEIAASGGYYAALAADEIVAQPSTLTGSIGVIIPTLNISSGLNRLGIDSKSLTSGPNKDLANPLEPRDARHDAILQTIVDEFYNDFRAKVLERRTNLDTGRIDEVTDGRILTGADAHRAGLVDHLGDIRTAFDRAKDLAGLESARLVKYLYSNSNRPRSPYTPAAAAPDTRAPHATHLNLNQGVQVNLDAQSAIQHLRPVAYYLWLPGAP